MVIGKLPKPHVTLAEIGIWMDILGSASLRQKPVHLEMYRDLLDLEWERPSQICLANTMGCDNRVRLSSYDFLLTTFFLFTIRYIH
jgi:hypothetical protein